MLLNVLQDEAYTDTYVSFSGDELWTVQEDGDFCTKMFSCFVVRE